MTIPLLVLAVFSILGGLLDLPFVTSQLDFLDRWLEPSLLGAHEPVASSFSTGFAALDGRAHASRSSASSSARAVYRNGLNADGTDPTVSGSAASPTCSRTATTSTTASAGS